MCRAGKKEKFYLAINFEPTEFNGPFYHCHALLNFFIQTKSTVSLTD